MMKMFKNFILGDETVHNFGESMLYWINPIYDQHLGRFCAQEAV